jgi:rare lipoprotein A (peptidoglycan hydrolase)
MVVVTITDRFPSTKGRIIDLSEAAFLAISPLKHGVIAVTMRPFIKEK